MFKRFKDRFGTAGVALGVIALILALSGTALAASGALSGKQKKEVEKIAKKFAGKPGAAGVAGTNGTNGTNGKDGAEGKQGPEGKAGTNGTNGTPGTNGKSPENVEEFDTSDARCAHSGGVVYEAEGVAGSSSIVCNGEKGAKGDTGEPWTTGGTLPPGATETGTWAFTGTTADTNGIHVSLSFPIRLASPLDEEHVHFALDADFTTFCKSNGTNPQPEPGNLCVYLTESVSESTFNGIFSSVEEGEKGALTMGAVLAFSAPTGAAAGGGSFAVRAP